MSRLKAKSTKKLSQELCRTESRIFVALSKLDEFLFSPQIRTHSGTVPEHPWNLDVENQEPTGHRSQNDPNPNAESSVYQTHKSIDSDQDEASHRRD